VAKWVKKDSSFASGSSGRVTRNINTQNANAAADAAAKKKQDAQLKRMSKVDKKDRHR